MKVLNKSKLTCTPANAVYIGRPSKWGNPFVIGVGGRTREQSVTQYKRWLWSQKDLLWAAGNELSDCDLVCHCAPLACHGDVLIAACDWLTLLPSRDYDKYFPNRKQDTLAEMMEWATGKPGPHANWYA